MLYQTGDFNIFRDVFMINVMIWLLLVENQVAADEMKTLGSRDFKKAVPVLKKHYGLQNRKTGLVKNTI